MIAACRSISLRHNFFGSAGRIKVIDLSGIWNYNT